MNNGIYFDDSSDEKKKFDNFFLGLFGSIFVSLLMIYLISLGYLKEEVELEERFKIIFYSMEFSTIMVASLIPSLVAFFVFYKTERWQSAYGLIVAVLLSMALVFIR